MSNQQTSDVPYGFPEIGDPEHGYWSIKGFARHLGVSTSYLYTCRDTGKLHAEPFGGTYAIPAKEAARFERARDARRKARDTQNTTQEGTEQ